MKKLVIGALVGGIIVFLWQMLSWTLLDLHAKEYQKAPGQDSIMTFLSSQFSEDGQFFLPHSKGNGASMEEIEKTVEGMKGKPWAVINYHKSYDVGDKMVNLAIRGLIADIIAVLFVCWILATNPNRKFGGIFISTVLIGIVGYLFIPYANHMWYQTPGAITNFIDVLLAWGLCGIWLGWWLSRK